MSNVSERIKITKTKFEQMLIAKHSFERLTATMVKEPVWMLPKGISKKSGGTYVNLTLYYVDDVHRATWMEGEGWEYELEKYHPDTGDRLTNCCGAYSTYMDGGVLCCKKCFNEVPVGQGDGAVVN